MISTSAGDPSTFSRLQGVTDRDRRTELIAQGPGSRRTVSQDPFGSGQLIVAAAGYPRVTVIRVRSDAGGSATGMRISRIPSR